MNQLDTVLDVLENHLPGIEDAFEDINWGGCGVMAELVAEQLDILCIDYEIICRTYSPSTLEQVNEAIDNEDSGGIPNSHVLIKVGNRYFDSEGEQVLNSGLVSIVVDRATISRMNDNLSFWNRVFDRDQVDGMREFTSVIFQKAA